MTNVEMMQDALDWLNDQLRNAYNQVSEDEEANKVLAKTASRLIIAITCIKTCIKNDKG